MTTKRFHLFLEQAQKNLTRDEESKTGCYRFRIFITGILLMLLLYGFIQVMRILSIMFENIPQ